MKIAKRFLAFALIAMLVAAMLVPASAAAPTKTITINNVAAGHKFEAYQIFGGDLEGSVLSNIRWGEGVDSVKLLEALEGHPRFGTQFAACETADDVATVLEEKSWTAADTDQFAKIVSGCLSATKHSSTDTAAPYKIDVPAGYYFVKDVTESLGDDDAYTKYIIHVTTNVAVNAKSEAPTMSKQVGLSPTEFTEAVSASVGDSVYFRLTANLKARTNDYSEYHIEFVDTLPAGLTYSNVESVKVSGLALDSTQQNTYGFAAVPSGDTVTFTLDKAKSAVVALTGTAVTANDTVEVIFKATVNGNIVVNATAGNTNTAYLKYSNNPNTADYATQLGKTSPSSAKVYSYGIAVDKIDGADETKKLADAKFKIYRTVGNVVQYVVANGGKVSEWTTDETRATEFVTGSNGAFSVVGLGKNTYYLKETAAPAGYNNIKEPIEVSFVASFNLSTGLVSGFTASVTGHGSAELESVSETEGIVTVQVKNSQGATLPETGGIGTPIFYIIGIVLIAGAAAVLFSRKRKNTKG